MQQLRLPDFLLLPHLEHSLALTTDTLVVVGASVGMQAFKVHNTHTGIVGTTVDAKRHKNKTNVRISVFKMGVSASIFACVCTVPKRVSVPIRPWGCVLVLLLSGNCDRKLQ